MKDLSDMMVSVYLGITIEEKRNRMVALIEASHAKKETKKLALVKLSQLKTANAIDKFATNYTLSGEGMKI